MARVLPVLVEVAFRCAEALAGATRGARAPVLASCGTGGVLERRMVKNIAEQEDMAILAGMGSPVLISHLSYQASTPYPHRSTANLSTNSLSSLP
jgi:hypothetical protein